ncbi:hypothetical protein Pst134EB_020072 [Puccinia striiformis f. sp. tritici]|nr:hypothetical protein Pst134EB_020072 [Puccinia striiformis f. sp. tritici]
MRSISNRGHAPVESISTPAGVDVLISVLRKGSIPVSMMSSKSGRAAIESTSIEPRSTIDRAQIEDYRAQIDWQSSSDRLLSNPDRLSIELRSTTIELRSTVNRAQMDGKQAWIDSQSIQKWQGSPASQCGVLDNSHAMYVACISWLGCEMIDNRGRGRQTGKTI